MPELPDLQVFSKNLNKELSGKKLKKFTALFDKKFNAPVKQYKKDLENQILEKIYREGKELRLKFSNGNVLGLHLMLRGNLYLFQKKNENKYTIIELLFDDNNGLAITDFQKMASASLNPEDKKSPDALSQKVSFKFLKDELGGSRATIKSFLMDQNIIRGIGNAYSDEILWEARISPFSISDKIPDDKIKDLKKAIRKVLTDAEKKIKKENPEIITGEIRDFLNIHNSRKDKSPTGAPIQQKSTSGRKTYFTNEQKLYK